MKLTVSRSQNSETYYIQKSYRTDSGKSSTKTVERLGSIEELKARFGEDDPVGAARAYMKELSAAEKKSREEIMVKFKPSALIPKGEQHSYNGGRWIIENGFRIFKTDFEARPVYVRRDDRIKAHFLTCFLALLIYKYLEKKVNRGEKHFTTEEIVDTLRAMDFLSVAGEGYIPTYTRTDLTNNLHGSAGFRTDTQIVTKQKMRSIIAQTKKREKDDDAE